MEFALYYNEIPEKIVKELTDYLVSKFSGKILRRQSEGIY